MIMPAHPLPQFNDERYRDLRFVADGGFADVYRAKDDKSGAVDRTVAIKVLRPDAPRTEWLKEAFKNEVKLLIEIAEKAGGSGFVQVIDNGETVDGMPFLVMPFASGGSLSDRRERIIGTDPESRKEVADRIVQFLRTVIEVLHSREIVHRDIKPANILIAADPDVLTSPHDPFVTDDESFLMSDLGLARKVHKEDKQFSLVGTDNYRAPELANPRARPTMATDLYSATATVLFCLTGVEQSDDRWVEIVEREFGQPILDWLHRGLAVEQTSRYQDPISWAGDFRAALSETDRSPASPSSLSMWLFTANRRPLLLVIAAVAIASLSILSVLITANGDPGTDADAETADDVSRTSEISGDSTGLATVGTGEWQYRWTTCGAAGETQEVGLQLGGHEGSVNDLAFDSTGRLVTTAGEDGTVKVWDTATGEIQRNFDGHRFAASSVVFGPTDSTVISTGDDQSIRRWAVTAAAEDLAKDAAHSDWIWSIDYDGRDRLATSSRDGTVSIWNAGTLEWESNLEDVTTVFRDLEFDPQGTMLATAGIDGSVWVWNTTDWVRAGPPFVAHEGARANRVSFSRDGVHLATAGSDHTIKVWDWKQRRQVGVTLNGHVAEVWGVDFLNEDLLLSSGSDGTVRLWDWQTGKEVAPTFSTPDDLEIWEVQATTDGVIGYVSKSGDTRLLCVEPA